MTNSNRVPDFRDLIKEVSVDTTLKQFNGEQLSIEERKNLETQERALSNAAVPLKLGVSAIGRLLANADENIELDTINNIGWLIDALGEQLFTLDENHANVLHMLSVDDLKIAKNSKAVRHE